MVTVRSDYWLPRGCTFYVNSSDTAQGLLRFLRNHPDTEYRTSDLAIQSGYEYQETKTAIRRLYGYKAVAGNRGKIKSKSVIFWKINVGIIPAIDRLLGGGTT